MYVRFMGLRIKTLREARGLTQQDLADMAGLSRSQLSEIENERKPANTLRLNAIASALGVNVDQLFSPDADAAYKGLILDLMAIMSPDDRETLIRFAQVMASKPKIDAG